MHVVTADSPAINVRSREEIGITIPDPLLARAELIE